MTLEPPVIIREVPQANSGSGEAGQLKYRLQYIIFTGALSGEPEEKGYKTFQTTGSLNTVRKLVAANLIGSRSKLSEAASATIKENRFNKKIGSNPEKKLKAGTHVRIPKRFLGAETHSVEVLAGEGAPTPSAGYAKWARVPRPQRKALTIVEGYEPFTLTVPIMFDAVRKNGVREDVEDQIQWLEWMGGRGVKFQKHGGEAVGQPPLVEVYSAKGADREVQLIPKPFQTPTLKWFVEDITWDEHPLRDTEGARIRQAAVVKLIEYIKDDTQ